MMGITGKGLRLGKEEEFKGGEKGGRVYGRGKWEGRAKGWNKGKGLLLGIRGKG